MEAPAETHAGGRRSPAGDSIAVRRPQDASAPAIPYSPAPLQALRACSPSDPAPVPSLPPPGTAAGPAHRGHVPVRPTWAGSSRSARGGECGRRWARRCCPLVAGGGNREFGTAGSVPPKRRLAGLEKDSTLLCKPVMKRAINSVLLVSSAVQLLKECVIRAQTWGL